MIYPLYWGLSTKSPSLIRPLRYLSHSTDVFLPALIVLSFTSSHFILLFLITPLGIIIIDCYHRFRWQLATAWRIDRYLHFPELCLSQLSMLSRRPEWARVRAKWRESCSWFASLWCFPLLINHNLPWIGVTERGPNRLVQWQYRPSGYQHSSYDGYCGCWLSIPRIWEMKRLLPLISSALHGEAMYLFFQNQNAGPVSSDGHYMRLL